MEILSFYCAYVSAQAWWCAYSLINRLLNITQSISIKKTCTLPDFQLTLRFVVYMKLFYVLFWIISLRKL